jgi:flagellar hook-associated protein 1 FlgK
VLQRLDTLVDGINFSHSALGAQWEQSRDNLEVLVADVNAAAESIAKLNQAIQRATQSGLPANDLTDQRDVLVMKVAEQIGGTARPGKDGMMDVVVGGISLVAGSTATSFTVAGTLAADNTTADPVRIVTSTGGYAVTPGGTAQGQLTAMNQIIPGYRTNLDNLAVQLATTLNTAHTAGYDLAGNPGVDILDSSGGPISAASLRVAFSNTDLIAASKQAPVGGVPSLDNGNADEIAQLRQSMTGVDASYRTMIVELGVQAAVTERSLGIQQVITTQVDSARESVAGVNLDEEMTNMLAYQHAYSAAGRLVTAIDETLDVLINRTGVVGR